MLSIKDLKSGYGKMQIVNGIDLDVDEGDVAVIIGPNGSGKSTLLKSIFNLVDIYDGKIEFDNTEITRSPTYKLIGIGVGFVPQGRQVFNSLNVRENLQMGGFLIKDKKIIEESVAHILNEHFPELKSKINEYAFSLSGGQQQMLAIGMALINKPKLLLLDEPSLGLAPKVMKELFLRIKGINKEGVTIIMVEQNAKQATAIADKIFVLEDGKIALKGGKEILESEMLHHIYLGGR